MSDHEGDAQQYSIQDLLPLQRMYRDGKRNAPKGWKRNRALHELHGCMNVWNVTLEHVALAIESGVAEEGDWDMKVSEIPEYLRSQQWDIPGWPPKDTEATS